MAKKILRIDGVSIVSLKQNKKSFINQKFLLTSEEDNTNVQFVVIHLGYRVDALQLRVFINFLDYFCLQKIVYYIDSDFAVFFIYTIEK